MSADVFISYAREDRDVARELAQTLSGEGYSIWWDRELVPGNEYADVIEKTLESAKAIIVLWSEAARKSHWVRDEAAVGRDRERLAPILLDSGQPPLGFRQVHTVSMEAVRSDPQTRQALLASLAAFCGRPAPAPTAKAKSAKAILGEEKRQRSFMATFWLTSFVISAIVSAALALMTGMTIDNARAGAGIVALGSFVWMGVVLVIGRFLIVIGRRLSKRKSVRYFDGPTSFIFILSALLGLTSLTAKQGNFADQISFVPLGAACLFLVFGALSIPVGFVRGLKRTHFEDGK